MRRICYIAVLVILYLVFTSKSCDNQATSAEAREQTALAAARDSLSRQFGADDLPGESLRIFESAAISKLGYFDDYLAIFGDTTIDTTFRNRAGEMIRKLFISEATQLKSFNRGNSGSARITLQELLAQDSDGAMRFGRVIPGSIRIKQSLQRAGISDYSGVLAYSAAPGMAESSPALAHQPVEGSIGYVLTRHQKIFGPDTLMIWELFLGNREQHADFKK